MPVVRVVRLLLELLLFFPDAAAELVFFLILFVLLPVPVPSFLLTLTLALTLALTLLILKGLAFLRAAVVLLIGAGILKELVSVCWQLGINGGCVDEAKGRCDAMRCEKG